MFENTADGDAVLCGEQPGQAKREATIEPDPEALPLVNHPHCTAQNDDPTVPLTASVRRTGAA